MGKGISVFTVDTQLHFLLPFNSAIKSVKILIAGIRHKLKTTSRVMVMCLRRLDV
jgi:hypothetical protein